MNTAPCYPRKGKYKTKQTQVSPPTPFGNSFAKDCGAKYKRQQTSHDIRKQIFFAKRRKQEIILEWGDFWLYFRYFFARELLGGSLAKHHCTPGELLLSLWIWPHWIFQHISKDDSGMWASAVQRKVIMHAEFRTTWLNSRPRFFSISRHQRNTSVFPKIRMTTH